MTVSTNNNNFGIFHLPVDTFSSLVHGAFSAKHCVPDLITQRIRRVFF